MTLATNKYICVNTCNNTYLYLLMTLATNKSICVNTCNNTYILVNDFSY